MRLIASIAYSLLTLILMAGVGAVLLAFAPNSPLPAEWNPTKSLNVTDPITPITQFKLQRALADGPSCYTALATGARFDSLSDLITSPQCGIADRVSLSRIGSASLRPVETRCQTALRLAMWFEHGIEPAAKQHFSQSISQIQHSSSYSCRQIRSTNGSTGRMSTHATADSIDISGVTLSDGRKLTLLSGWPSGDARAPFFRDLRNSACTWFRVTLGPDYNSLHADHFHLQHTGWGLCR
ncbi:MAG: extensin family protein [Tateyamaria sp.]|uniref:extensin-like domain-containing protein n=1 Tax=Tateyamaria sp. TaxID=1929288 RepID=UPI00329C542F